MDRRGFLLLGVAGAGALSGCQSPLRDPAEFAIDGVDYPSSVPYRDDLSVSVRIANVDCLRRPII